MTVSTIDRHFFAEIAGLLSDARSAAKRAVDSAMVSTYWRIGQRIVEQEQQGKSRAGYGDALIVNLSRYLGETFGKGFSEANLKNMRQFYLVFPDFPEFARHCLANPSCSNINFIMRLGDKQERQYYLLESAMRKWRKA